MCRAVLVRESEVGNGLTVIGDECHIVSAVPGGPRAGEPVEDLDAYENLILLCPNDHRLIDSLVHDYSRDRLLAMKRGHEDWVRTTLAAPDGLSPLTILRAQPAALRYLPTAQELLSVVVSAEESSLDHETIETEDDLDLVAGFLQLVDDHAEMWDDYEPAFRIRVTFELDREMKTLKEQGRLVFGARAHGKLRGGRSGGDSDWDTAYLRLVRAHSSDILRFDLSNLGDSSEAGSSGGPRLPDSRSPEPAAGVGGPDQPLA